MANHSDAPDLARSRASSGAAFRIEASTAPFKLVLSGVVGVGKTSLLERFRSNKFNAVTHQSGYSCSTATSDKYTLKRTINEDRFIVDIFDTAGLERYDSLTPNYYANSRAVILVFSLTDLASMFALASVREQAEEGTMAVHEDCYFALVGNKLDLEHEVDIPTNQIMDAKTALKCDRLFLTSAKTGEGVKDMFETIVKEVYDKAKLNDIVTQTTIVSSVQTKRCCK